MLEYKLRTHAFLIVIMLVPFLALMPGQGDKRPITGKDTKDKRLPVVDYDAEEPGDLDVKAKRRAKASRYDEQTSTMIQDAPWLSGEIVRKWTTHWHIGLSALPFAESDTVIIGTVSQAQAHLSNDKTGIYSDFNVKVDEVLKKDDSSVTVGAVLSAERYGGTVRFRSGSIQRHEVNGQGMPGVGRRYLLFLKRLDRELNFKIVTGYDITGHTVSPLDGSEVEEGTQTFPFDKYQGFDTSAFLELVRAEVAKTNNS